MSYSFRQQVTSVICTLLLIGTPVFVTSCSDDSGGIAGAGLSLSKIFAAPGELITIYSNAIAKGSTIQATLRSTSGYEVVMELQNTQNGSGQVMVPPYIDPATGAFQAGTVSVSISGVAVERNLIIADLPDTGNAEPGEIMRAVLEVAIESYQFNLINIDTIGAELGDAVDIGAATLAINDRIAELQALLSELASTGQITVDMGDGQTQVLGADELRIADQILLAFFGQMEANSLTGKPLPTGRDIAECLRVSDDQRLDCLKQVLDGIRRDTGRGTNLASMVATGVGLVVFGVGVFSSSPLVALTGVIVGAIGVAASFTNAAVNEQNTDAFLNRNGAGFNASQETASQSIRFISGAASNLPGPPGLIAGTTSAGLAVKDLVEGAVAERCRTDDGSNQQSVGEVTEFCTTVLGNGSGGDDDDDTDGDDTPGGTFTILNYVNTDGSMGSSATAADISVSGSATAPVISWSVSNVFSVFVTSGSSALYGITGERTDNEGDIEQVPFAFSSVTYGDYGRSNTVPMEGVSASAPPLQSGPLYSITIGTLDGKTAVLNFRIGS